MFKLPFKNLKFFRNGDKGEIAQLLKKVPLLVAAQARRESHSTAAQSATLTMSLDTSSEELKMF